MTAQDRPRTCAIHTGTLRTPEGEQSEALFLTSSFAFSSAAEAAARFSGDQPGNIYSRFTNPTVRTFEQRLARLEGAERGIATASGMAAILSLCLGLLRHGDHLVAAINLFGTTIMLFKTVLQRAGITVSFVSLTDYAAWQAAIRPQTRLLFLETPSNPLTAIADIARLAELARQHHCLLAVDNCFCTPALQRPVQHGADLVVHSATKYLDGQGRCVGGAVLGPAAQLDEDLFAFLRTAGPSMSPFNAWVFSKGLETLAIRMQAHCTHAMELAEWLQSAPQVERVYYPGLQSHPQHALAARQQDGYGGIIAFVVHGGRKAAWALIDQVRLYSITANLGDTRSTITHPATTTHWRLGPEEREQIGITEGLVRISAGLEDPADLRADLAAALARLPSR